MVLIGYFNSNLLNFYQSNSVNIYVNKLFRNNLLTLINELTGVTSKSISAIDHINTNFLLNSYFKSAIIKLNLSDHCLYDL